MSYCNDNPENNLSKSNLFAGSIVAIVTPFSSDGRKVDYDRLAQLISLQKEGGTSAIVPCGTTGESPTLTHSEHDEVIKFTITEAHKLGMKVLAGTGSNSTEEAKKLTLHAKELQVDGCLIVVPYYNKPCPKGLLQHFQILDSVDIPLVLYNIPGRTGINVSVDTTLEILKNCKNLVGVKASNGDLEQITDLISKVPPQFSVLSGDDSLTLPILSVGGCGVVSVLANVMPKAISKLVDLYNKGLTIKAKELNLALFPLMNALLKIGPNPCPIKSLMNKLGINVGPVRLPLSDITESDSEKLLTEYNLAKAKFGSLK